MAMHLKGSGHQVGAYLLLRVKNDLCTGLTCLLMVSAIFGSKCPLGQRMIWRVQSQKMRVYYPQRTVGSYNDTAQVYYNQIKSDWETAQRTATERLADPNEGTAKSKNTIDNDGMDSVWEVVFDGGSAANRVSGEDCSCE